MLEHRAAEAPPEEGVGDAHRLELAAVGGETLWGAAADDVVVEPGGPEGDAGLLELVDVEGVDALRGGVRVHAGEVAGDEAADRFAGEVVEVEAEGRGHGAHQVTPGGASRSWRASDR